MSKTMQYSAFTEGIAIGLADMLTAREERAQRQLEILDHTSDRALLSATMNIPGPIKKNQILKQCFDQVMTAIDKALKDDMPEACLYVEENTGMEYYLLTSLTPEELKRRMVVIEEEHPYGRIFDLDVLWLEEGQLHMISRTDIGLPKRKCFICQREAKDCARSRRHSVDEMQKKISEIIHEGRNKLHD